MTQYIHTNKRKSFNMTFFAKFIVLFFLLAIASSSHDLEARQYKLDGIASSSHDLEARQYKLDGMAFSCLNSLLKIRTCIKDVRVIFRNGGKWKVSLNCCNAIKSIERECLPDLLNLMGFSPKEVRIIDDHCNIGTKIH